MRDSGSVNGWVHLGRLWTNGEPFLAMDVGLRADWRGHSDESHFDQVVEAGIEVTSLPVGTGRAVLVGGDGVVRDDSWIEVLTSDMGTVALVQASGPDYGEALSAALSFPSRDDDDGDPLSVPSGDIALFSSAVDGLGPHSTPLADPRPGPVPVEHGPPSSLAPDPGLLLRTGHTCYTLKVRWYTELGDDRFARWLLTPTTTQ
uniref:Uncharacterized protein n=1 Tax=Pseudofrankia asymbiotica TaxID=1834516 RepID=A0A1V2IH68_9ACTN